MLTLAVNGTHLTGFTHAQAGKTMTSLSGTYLFQATGTEKLDNFPVKPFDEIEVFADNIKLLTGFVEKLQVNYAKDTYTVIVSGRELTADIIDSRLSATFTKTNSVTLLDFINNVFKAVGLTRYTVLDTSNNEEPFFATDQQIGGTGESVYDFIKTYSLKKSTVLLTDENGNVVIANSGANRNGYNLLNIVGGQNNIYKASVTYDTTGLFNIYEYRTFANFNDVDDRGKSLEQQTNVIAIATDDNIRTGRRYVDIDADSYTQDKLQDRALWRLNSQIANSRKYTVILNGHSFIVNNQRTLIKINELIKVRDEIAGVDEVMLVESTNYTMNENGNLLALTLVQKDTYSLLAEDVILSNVWYQPTGDDDQLNFDTTTTKSNNISGRF